MPAMNTVRCILLLTAVVALAACGGSRGQPATDLAAPADAGARPHSVADEAAGGTLRQTPMVYPGSGARLSVEHAQAGLRQPAGEWLPDRFVVSFRPSVAPSAGRGRAGQDLPASLIHTSADHAALARTIADRYGLTLCEEAYYKGLNFAAYRTTDGDDAAEVMARIAADYAASIEHVEYDGLLRAAYSPDDPYFPDDLWGLIRINADDAWDTQKGDSGVLVAIIDGGVRYSGDSVSDAPDHEDLASVCLHPPDHWPQETFDLFDDDNVPEDEQPIGHGTRVMGIAGAAGDNGKGVVGAAYGITLVPIRVYGPDGSTTQSTVAAAIALAAAIEADVANLSLSGTPGFVLETACAQAAEDGLLLVAAAGNDDSSGPRYPAAYETVLGVGATDLGDDRASFSNYGAWVDLAAPGVDIWSCTKSTTSAYNSDWGTSYASPLVAGAAALLLSYDDTLSRDELWAALVNTGPLLPAAQWGAGDIRRLDIDAALDWVIDQPPEISILSPADGATVSGSVSFTVEVTDNTGVALTELYVDDVLKAGFDTGGTLTYIWPTTDYHGGPHTLSVYAEDDAGTHSAKAIAVTVMNQQISAVSPPAAERGDSVVVQGSYFIGDGGDSFDPFTDQLHFTTQSGWVRAVVSDWQQTAITAAVPAAAVIGPLMVSIDGAEQVSGFDFWLPPSIDSLDPDVQVVGGQVTITGYDFGDAPGEEGAIAIGTVEAAPIMWSYDEIVIVVPPGVAQAELTVTTAGGVSNGILFTPKPEITLIHPWPAWVGAEVTITGTSFGASQGSSTLEFGGGALASGPDVISWADTLITALVPLDAESGDVTVTVNAVASEGYNLRLGLPPPEIVDAGQL